MDRRQPQRTATLRWIALAAVFTGAAALMVRRSPRNQGGGTTTPRLRRPGDELGDLYSTTRCDLGEQASFPLRCSSTPRST